MVRKVRRCSQCQGQLGLGVRSRNLWNGRWCDHLSFCSARCEHLYKEHHEAAPHWFRLIGTPQMK